MTPPEHLLKHAILNCDVEINQPDNPILRASYYQEAGIDALIDQDFGKYRLCRRGLAAALGIELIERRTV